MLTKLPEKFEEFAESRRNGLIKVKESSQKMLQISTRELQI